jgi:hypothetical protein
MYLVALNLSVNNQLNSSLRQIIDSNTMSNDGLITENMDLSRIHLAVQPYIFFIRLEIKKLIFVKKKGFVVSTVGA